MPLALSIMNVRYVEHFKWPFEYQVNELEVFNDEDITFVCTQDQQYNTKDQIVVIILCMGILGLITNVIIQVGPNIIPSIT